MTALLQPGFADPVRDTQRCFRAVLDALSHPGRIARLSDAAAPILAVPILAVPISAAAAAVALTLVDHETPLWLDAGAAAARDWLAFHCGAPMAAGPADCAFAVTLSLPELGLFSAGTHEAPETSATIVCQVTAFETGRAFRLTGPGLREPATLIVDGLPHDFAARWAKNHALFPCGIDLILCAGDRLTALPRTVAIEEV